jgi:putative transcriptional regulator
MSRRWFARLGLIIAAVALPATLLNASLNSSNPPTPHASLAGQVLIATPSMADPRFSRTVIFMVKHDRNGALGIVINRPAGDRTIAQILEAIGERASGAEGTIPIFVGGPVDPQRGFVLHSAEYDRPETLHVDGRVAMTSSRETLRDIAANRGPRKAIVAFGYAGWGPGQLEGELKMDAWYTAPADLKLIFDDDRDKVWDNAMARRPRDI